MRPWAGSTRRPASTVASSSFQNALQPRLRVLLTSSLGTRTCWRSLGFALPAEPSITTAEYGPVVAMALAESWVEDPTDGEASCPSAVRAGGFGKGHVVHELAGFHVPNAVIDSEQSPGRGGDGVRAHVQKYGGIFRRGHRGQYEVETPAEVSSEHSLRTQCRAIDLAGLQIAGQRTRRRMPMTMPVPVRMGASPAAGQPHAQHGRHHDGLQETREPGIHI